MNDQERKQLALDYIAYYEKYSIEPPTEVTEGSDAWRMREQAWWVDDLVCEEPETAWAVILEILTHDMKNETLAVFAAGPVETLLSLHGTAFIDRVEEQARKDAKFRDILGGVWKLDTKDDIWARVEKARNYKTW